MLVSPTRPITLESSRVPCRLPKPTRHPIGLFLVKTYAKGHPKAPRNKAWIQRFSRFPQ